MKKATAEYIVTMLRNEADGNKDNLEYCALNGSREDHLAALLRAWREALLRLSDFEEWFDENEDILDESED